MRPHATGHGGGALPGAITPDSALAGLTPLREPSYFILAALIDGPQHGYAIAQRAGELSEGRVRLTAGTLYGALDRLAGEGLVEEDHEEVVNGRRRRYHRLTDAGSARLDEEAVRLRATAEVVLSRTARDAAARPLHSAVTLTPRAARRAVTA